MHKIHKERKANSIILKQKSDFNMYVKCSFDGSM